MDSVFHLDEVVIENRLYASSVGLRVLRIDSGLLAIHKGGSLAEVLRRSGLGEIRGYGTNGIASASLRGTSFSHTLVLWNGINLQSPLGGGTDLSQLATTAANEISIIKGGATPFFGSGAIGGAIQLNNQWHFNRNLHATATLERGSFGHLFQNYEIEFGTKTFATHCTLYGRNLENNYPYVNNYVKPQQTDVREHADLTQKGFTGQTFFRINNSHLLGVRMWIQKHATEIPSPIFSAPSHAEQEDQFQRFMIHWAHNKEHIAIEVKSAYLNQSLYFKDSPNAPTSNNSFYSLVNRLEIETDISKTSKIISGINYRKDVGHTASYGGETPFRENYAVFISHNYQQRNINTSITARQEYFDRQFSPLLASLGVSYLLSPFLKLQGNVTNNYRIPTFNDLYWQGAGGIGNQELQPETSTGGEISLATTPNNHWQLNVTAYHASVKNWIAWSPTTATIWAPKNIKKVRIQGAEATIEREFLLNHVDLNCGLSYVLSMATNREVSDDGNDKELNKQLMYTPLHSGNLHLTANYQSFGTSIFWNYTGKQYTDGENHPLTELPSYQLLNATVSYQRQIAAFSGNLRMSVNNLLNRQYENRRGYPMYGRNFLLSVTLNFKSKEK